MHSLQLTTAQERLIEQALCAIEAQAIDEDWDYLPPLPEVRGRTLYFVPATPGYRLLAKQLTVLRDTIADNADQSLATRGSRIAAFDRFMTRLHARAVT